MPHTIVITGGHTGLGLATSRQLLAAAPTAHLVWATRSPKAAEQAAAGLATPGRITILPLDLTALTNVRHFAAELRQRLAAGSLPPLGAVVCNAGIQFAGGAHWTAEGVEQTFGVNHLAHFLLVELLLPALEPAGRVVLVSSGTHFDKPQDWTAAATGLPVPQYLGAAALARGEVPAGLDPASAKASQFRYVTSKLCNLLFMYELDRRLRAAGSAVTVTAFDPGLMPGTGLARANPPAAQWVWNHILPAFRVLPGINSVPASGRNLARLVTAPALAGVSGQYFVGQKAVPSSALSRRPELATDLWAASEKLVAAQPAAISPAAR